MKRPYCMRCFQYYVYIQHTNKNYRQFYFFICTNGSHNKERNHSTCNFLDNVENQITQYKFSNFEGLDLQNRGCSIDK